MSAAQAWLVAALAVPVAGAVVTAACGALPRLRDTLTMVTAFALFGCVAALWEPVVAGVGPALVLLEPMPGLRLAFAVEPLGLLFALVASSLWIVNSLYSIGYMRANDEANQTRFYVCFALALAATMGIAFSANVFTLFIFYEVLTLVTYPLVTHHGTPEARRGGRVYLLVLIGTSTVLLLPAVIVTWFVAGTTDFAAGGILAGRLGDAAIGGLLALYMLGIGKAALMPFHRWLPSAMVAPTPVSALLHAVAVVKAGVFSVLKVIVYVFGPATLASSGTTGWLVALAGFTIIAASVIALRSDNLKRRLAYSTVSQLSYVVIAAALLFPLSLIAAAVHIAAHAVSKITLFFAAGAVYTAGHKTEVSQLDGIGRQMPWTMGAFAIATLSMIGLPPAIGFVSKWYLVSGAVAQSRWAVVGVVLAGTLLSAAYLLPIVYRAFLRPLPDGGADRHGEAPWPMVLALSLTAAGTLALFFLPDVPLQLAYRMIGR